VDPSPPRAMSLVQPQNTDRKLQGSDNNVSPFPQLPPRNDTGKNAKKSGGNDIFGGVEEKLGNSFMDDVAEDVTKPAAGDSR